MLFFRCAALAALTAVLIALTMFINSARQSVEKIPIILDSQMTATRADIAASLRDTTAMLDRNTTLAVGQLNSTLNRQGDATREAAVAELEAARKDADHQFTAQLTRANDSLAHLASVAAPAGAVLNRIDSALPFYTDCDAGMCLANIIYGIGKNTEHTLKSVDKTMEVIAEKSPPVALSVEKGAAALELRSRQSILHNLFFSLK